MPLPLDRTAAVYVAGHRGLVGAAVWRRLKAAGFTNLHGVASRDADLRDRDAARDVVATIRPAAVVLAAAKVGGILANAEAPVGFLEDNLRIQTNVMAAAHEYDVDRLLFLGSSCIYPKFAPQPIPESALLTGGLEPTNEAYAIAKIAGIVAVRSYRRQHGRHWIAAMPTNLYGPQDTFDLRTGHVLPALIRRFHEAVATGADRVTLWGSGEPRREFLHTDDLAAALLFLLDRYDGDSHVNVGTGTDVTIRDLAALIGGITGFRGAIDWDPSKPDGTPRKLLDTSLINGLGWQPRIDLRSGIESTYRWFLEHGPASAEPD